MSIYINFVVPAILTFLMVTSYFTQDKLFMLILALGNMAIFWMIGRTYEKERG
ncbi:hypothetical protein BH780_gp136 [Bacillus phage Eldridge]|uniref:Uncharacterized protein n=1 Tax=Bacillus phage Eldridge TaxID=1776293 RepID=A0A0Y0AHN0_9CAUD|nr:hypothetical protein BH780_gp136 [Bacillus phage Eldridge]AMB18719.1 hypothetical protein Eldridge_0139 [Bacillus phage Eldridge]